MEELDLFSASDDQDLLDAAPASSCLSNCDFICGPGSHIVFGAYYYDGIIIN